jgi:quercetin dioxygenase-like cupin family protein
MTNLSAATAVLAPGRETAVLDHLDMLCRVVLDGDQTQGSYAIVEERAALGAMTPQHVHQREAETFIVLDGALEGWCAGATSLVEAGSMIHLPAGVDHAFRVASSSAHFYTLITPAGFERFFADTGAVLTQPFEGQLPIPGPPPPDAAERLQEVLTPLGVTITGPPPFQIG